MMLPRQRLDIAQHLALAERLQQAIIGDVEDARHDLSGWARRLSLSSPGKDLRSPGYVVS
jgi:hypothetical protein